MSDTTKPPEPDRPAMPIPLAESWSRKKFVFILLFILAFHVSLVVLFGVRRMPVPRPVTGFPQLTLADSANEFVSLSDPTLFARPNQHDIASRYWRQMPPATQPDFDWPAPAGYLPPAAGNFGALFQSFMQQSHPPAFALDLKPVPTPVLPEFTYQAAQTSTTMEISGDLASRRLLTSVDPPTLVRNEVLGQTKIQALVDTIGNVASAVVLKSADENADQAALRLVRNLRFAPAARLAFGEIIFTWHTVSTNTAPAPAP